MRPVTVVRRRRRTPSSGRRAALGAAGVVSVLVALVLSAAPAWAHTGFESSDPAEGSTTAEPVDQITLRFTGEASPAGTGFEVLDPSGEVLVPRAAPVGDGTTWVLTLDEPIAGGVVGVRWMVQAPDAHPIDGSFSFTVDGPVAQAPLDEPTPDEIGDDDAAAVPDEGTDRLEGFLADQGGSSTETGELVASIGRIVGMAGTLIGIGALAFAAFVLRGSGRDVRHVLYWVRRAGVVVIAGAVVRFVGRVLVDNVGDWSALADPGALADVASTTTGFAIALRFAGGVILVTGCRLQLRHAADAPDPVARVQRLAGVGAAALDAPVGARASEVAAAQTHAGSRSTDLMWAPGSGAVVSLVGAAALLAGYLFDGHTVTEGNRLVTDLTDVVHVLAAAVWVGGLLMLVSVLRRRHRRGEDLRALHLAARFSVVAVVALVAVAVSGLVLAAIVLDSVSELWTTPWGRLLLAKVTFVAVAAGLGGYNHRVLVPAMEADPHAGPPAHRFRSVAAVEAGVLVAVIVVTAFLVGAAS